MEYKTYNKKFISLFNEKLNKEFKRARLIYTHENSSICPECGAKTILDKDMSEIYCTQCGLIVKSSIQHCGVKWLNNPYGLLL